MRDSFIYFAQILICFAISECKHGCLVRCLHYHWVFFMRGIITIHKFSFATFVVLNIYESWLIIPLSSIRLTPFCFYSKLEKPETLFIFSAMWHFIAHQYTKQTIVAIRNLSSGVFFLVLMMPFFGFDAISYWWTMLSMSICHIFIAIHLCYFKIGTMFRNFETTQRQQHQYDFSCVLLFGGTMVLFFLFILSVFHLLFHCVYFFHVNISTHFKHIIYIPLLCSRQCKSCVTFLSTLKIW